MQSFNELGLPQPLIQSLGRMNFSTPTPIQAKAIPVALEGKDVLGSAQTGTGKTAAFGIPLVAGLLNSPRGTALILTPTRELATQVMDTLKQLLASSREIKTALLIGGESMPAQIQQLRARPRVIVGTPGRVNDHLARGTLMLHETNFLVLDETDRMLDLGFGVQLEKIARFLTNKRQTLMFSATMPSNIVKLSEKYLNNPVRISVGSPTATAPKIKQEVLHTNEAEKYDQLLNQLDQRNGSIIVFVKTKYGADRLASKLNRQQYSADAIHGDLRQNKRDRVIANYRDSRFRILVATDIAARGLDIPHIEHVINYDLPQCPEDYIHRIGRTARAGAEGSSLCLLTNADRGKWKAIVRLLDPSQLPEGATDKHPDAYKPQNRSSRPQDGEQRKPSGKRKFGDRSFGERKFGDRKKFDDRNASGERKQFDDSNLTGERQHVERPFRGERKQFDDRPTGNRQFSERKFGDRKKSDDRPSGERQQHGDRPFRERKQFDDRPTGERKFGDRKKFDDRPNGERKQQGDRPFRERKQFDDRSPNAERASGGERKRSERKDGERQFGYGNKNGGGKGRKPFGGGNFKKRSGGKKPAYRPAA